MASRYFGARSRGNRSMYDDDENRSAKEKAHYLDVYQDCRKLASYLREQYVDSLRTRVAKQRREINEKFEAIRQRAERERFERTHASHEFHKKLERHKLSSNVEFVSKVEKSKFYQALSEERQLEAAGGLRTQADREAFWARMFDFMYPRPGPSIPERPSLEYRTTNTNESRGGGGGAPLPQIQTPSHSQNQTPKNRASMMLMRRTTEGTTLDDIESGSEGEEAEASRRRTPKAHDGFRAQKPELKSLEIDLSPAQMNPEALLKHAQLQVRRAHRELGSRQLEHMYGRAVVNGLSSSQRELERAPKPKQVVAALQEPRLRDLIEHFDLIDSLREEKARVKFRGARPEREKFRAAQQQSETSTAPAFGDKAEEGVREHEPDGDESPRALLVYMLAPPPPDAAEETHSPPIALPGRELGANGSERWRWARLRPLSAGQFEPHISHSPDEPPVAAPSLLTGEPTGLMGLSAPLSGTWPPPSQEEVASAAGPPPLALPDLAARARVLEPTVRPPIWTNYASDAAAASTMTTQS